MHVLWRCAASTRSNNGTVPMRRQHHDQVGHHFRNYRLDRRCAGFRRHGRRGDGYRQVPVLGGHHHCHRAVRAGHDDCQESDLTTHAAQPGTHIAVRLCYLRCEGAANGRSFFSAEALARMSAAGDLKRGVRDVRAWLKRRYRWQWYAGRY
ncbi:hypothetical protein XFF6992_280049 [Xanthomonas citri pv. fuscans]|nr:hypothetical protein XFF6992_280049 [Xanthomonas citri pv. fuscans]SOO32972.1 hypothetical protein XFF6994_2510007 [Xanthomonas citri pv. fuscans]